MTALETDDLAVITGPLVFVGNDPGVNLASGEVVRILEPVDEDGDVLALGLETGYPQYIALSSLTPLSELHTDSAVNGISEADASGRATAPPQWGDLLDPDYVHDYVYTGDDE